MPNPPTHLLKDLLNPDNEMFLVGGMKPQLCIVGIHPNYDERIEEALKGLNHLMRQYMLEENMALIVKEEIELLSGRSIILHDGAILISCAYENAEHKVMYLDLHAPQTLSLH